MILLPASHIQPFRKPILVQNVALLSLRPALNSEPVSSCTWASSVAHLPGLSPSPSHLWDIPITVIRVTHFQCPITSLLCAGPFNGSSFT